MFELYEFHWRAISRLQQKQHGILLAKNRADAEHRLLAKGFSHIRLRRNFILPSEPKSDDIARFLQQLTLLLNSAIPLKNALSMLLESCRQIRLYLWIENLIFALEQGYAFSDALAKNGRYLTVQEIRLLKMAERGGNLAHILGNIALAREKSEKLKRKVKKILAYPLIILAIALTLSVLLLLFIVPQFAELYQGRTVPLITELLFALSDFLNRQGIPLLIGLLLLFGLFMLISKKTALFTRLKSALLPHLPLFGQIVGEARTVFFCQNLALMLNAHIRLDAALQAFLNEKNADPTLDNAVRFMLNALAQGYPFADALNPSLFGNDTVQMIRIGEQSGNLAAMTAQAGEIYQQKLDTRIDLLSQLLEPLLMAVMGVIVGTIIVGLYLPIFDMGGMVE